MTDDDLVTGNLSGLIQIKVWLTFLEFSLFAVF